MRIPTWRLVLTGGAITLLAIAGIGLAAAAGAPVQPAASVATAEQTERPDAAGAGQQGAGQQSEARLRDGARGPRLLRLGRHLVHAEVTVTDRDGNLVHLQLDHGTIQSIGGDSVTIAEAGGGTETVSTDDATIVRIGRAEGDPGDLTVGAEVFVQSRIDGGTALAKWILVIPPAGG